jgi:hypothetical protein
LTIADDAEVFFYPFGGVVFHDIDREKRQEILDRLRAAAAPLVTDVVREDFIVEEDPASPISVANGVLLIEPMNFLARTLLTLLVLRPASASHRDCA